MRAPRFTPPKVQFHYKHKVIRRCLSEYYWHCGYCGCVSPGNFPNNMEAREDWGAHRTVECQVP